MENASKALVIAGAILISILIIGLGVFIYNGAQGTVKKANLNSQEAQAQNSQFESYFNDHVSATELKQLLSLIRSNNITGKANNEDKMIFVNSYLSTSPIKDSNNKDLTIKNGSYYTVQVANDKAVKPSTEAELNPGEGGKVPGDNDAGYYDNGFIRNISVKENRGSSGSSSSSSNP